MRTLKEISDDIARAASRLDGLRSCNVYGKTLEELADIHQKYIEAQRAIHRLRLEEEEYITSR